MKSVDDAIVHEGYYSDGENLPLYNAVQNEVATGYDFEEN